MRRAKLRSWQEPPEFSAPFADREALARNEDGCGRVNTEFLGVVALVDSDADAAARIGVEQGIADGNIHESSAKSQHERFSVKLKTYFVAQVVAEFFEFVAGNVCNEGAKGIVETDDFAGDSF